MEQDFSQTQNTPKQKSYKGLLITFIILSCAAVGVIIALIIVIISLNANNYPSPSSAKEGESNSSNNNEDNPSIDISDKKNNTQREDDIYRFMTAANNFQTNNNGRTPWYGGKTNQNFVRRYIDSKCTAPSDGEPDDSCGDEFRDPDGEPYFFVYQGTLSSNKKVNLTKDHGIYVYTNAICGSEGEVITANGVRQYAMLYKLSNGSITCIDNH